MVKTITFKEKTLTLIGRMLELGQKVPNFNVVGQNLENVSLSDFSGKVKVLTTFPSLDTPVCDLQIKDFNRGAVNFSEDVVVIGISKDLPFAQARFCAANEIERVKLFSDYQNASFGINYGLLIKELKLLARAIIIIDKNDLLRYFQVVPELTKSPNYEEGLEKLGEVLHNPILQGDKLEVLECLPCKKGAIAMEEEEISESWKEVIDWQILENKYLQKEFSFKDFSQAKEFCDLLSVIAQTQGHHPELKISWGKAVVILTTHAVSGLTKNDFVMAKIIDKMKM